MGRSTIDEWIYDQSVDQSVDQFAETVLILISHSYRHNKLVITIGRQLESMVKQKHGRNKSFNRLLNQSTEDVNVFITIFLLRFIWYGKRGLILTRPLLTISLFFLARPRE
jgi:hypothetical protein